MFSKSGPRKLACYEIHPLSNRCIAKYVSTSAPCTCQVDVSVVRIHIGDPHMRTVTTITNISLTAVSSPVDSTCITIMCSRHFIIIMSIKLPDQPSSDKVVGPHPTAHRPCLKTR